MPIYDYYCEKCNIQEEIISGVNDVITHVCGQPMQRKFAIPRIICKPNYKDKTKDYLGSDESQYLTPKMKQEILKDLERQ